MDVANDEYQAILRQLNQAMLATDKNRVPLLKRILVALANPDRQFHIIHLAGTNGKGSTGAMLAAILQAAGFKVGHFSSPGIFSDLEQIRVQRQPLSAANFVKTYQKILPVLQSLGLQATDVTIFEWFFLVAIVYFATIEVDWVILEAGLGGAFDATNAIHSPNITVFTTIALDHTAILGDTITEIAQNKAQIIKPKTVVVTAGNQPATAMQVIEDTARRVAVPLWNSQGVHIIREALSLHNQVVSVTGTAGIWLNLKLRLLGDYQLINLQTVLQTIEILREQAVEISDLAVRTALQRIKVFGRLSVLNTKPVTIADGAHNPAGMQALVASLQQLVPEKQYVWILGILKDKQAQQMLQMLLPTAKRVITLTPEQPTRARSAAELAGVIEQMNTAASAETAESMAVALNRAKADNLPIIISGSFYVLKELSEMGDDNQCNG